jgi:hypothetical protein
MIIFTIEQNICSIIWSYQSVILKVTAVTRVRDGYCPAFSVLLKVKQHVGVKTCSSSLSN